MLEEANDLYLNIIDPPGPLFMPPLFTSFLEFAVRNWEEGKNILIHCNQGESRAPSMGLLFLASIGARFRMIHIQRLGQISKNSIPSISPGREYKSIYQSIGMSFEYAQQLARTDRGCCGGSKRYWA